MLPQFRKHRQSTPTALPQPRKHRPSTPTDLPRLRKHRPSVRQHFRGSGSIVRVLDRPSAAQEASSDYSRLITSAGFSCAARQTRQLILNPTTNNKTRKTPNARAIGIGI